MKIAEVNIRAAIGAALNMDILAYTDKSRSTGYDFTDHVGTAAVFEEFGPNASPVLTIPVSFTTSASSSAIQLRVSQADMSATGLSAGPYVWNCKIRPTAAGEDEEWMRGSFELLPEGV